MFSKKETDGSGSYGNVMVWDSTALAMADYAELETMKRGSLRIETCDVRVALLRYHTDVGEVEYRKLRKVEREKRKRLAAAAWKDTLTLRAVAGAIHWTVAQLQWVHR